MLKIAFIGDLQFLESTGFRIYFPENEIHSYAEDELIKIKFWDDTLAEEGKPFLPDHYSRNDNEIFCIDPISLRSYWVNETIEEIKEYDPCLIFAGQKRVTEEIVRRLRYTGYKAPIARLSVFFGKPSIYTGLLPEEVGYSLDIKKDPIIFKQIITNRIFIDGITNLSEDIINKFNREINDKEGQKFCITLEPKLKASNITDIKTTNWNSIKKIQLWGHLLTDTWGQRVLSGKCLFEDDVDLEDIDNDFSDIVLFIRNNEFLDLKVNNLVAIVSEIYISSTMHFYSRCIMREIPLICGLDTINKLIKTGDNVRIFANPFPTSSIKFCRLDFQPKDSQLKVFIGSSSEGLHLARFIKDKLHRFCFPLLWSESVFQPSQSSLDSLINSCNECDFAILILTADDILTTRGSTTSVPRDNLIFELGMFMGALEPRRVLFLFSQNNPPKLPSDLAGITAITYDETPNIKFGLEQACKKIVDYMNQVDSKQHKYYSTKYKLDETE